MKKFALLLSILAFLTGCATLSTTDRQLLAQHRVPPPLYNRMTHREPLTVPDIIELSQRQVPPQFILRYLDETDTSLRLSRADVTRMRKAGVSSKVIDYILDTAPPVVSGRYSDDYYGPYPYYRRSYYAPSPYYAPYPYYYGGPTVIIGGGYWGHGYWGHGGWYHGGWHHH
jgi:hypothetical protein